MSSIRFKRHHTPSSASSSLRLPSLPKFHPATYNSGSSESSALSTPSTTVSSPSPTMQLSHPYAPSHPSPMSPQRRQYSEAQRQLLMYQRDLLSPRGAPRSPAKPASPHLQPLGSPGPVTPLELEEDPTGEGYLVAGLHAGQLSEKAKEQILDVWIEKEVKGARVKRRREDIGHSRDGSR